MASHKKRPPKIRAIAGEKHDIKRVAGGRFAPGESANPAGKLPGTKNFTTKVKDALEKIYENTAETGDQLLVRRVLKKAIVDGNTQMIIHMWEQMDGKPVQKVVQTSHGLVEHTVASQKRARELADKFEKELKAHVFDESSESADGAVEQA